ncbi:hypothetical protein KR009_008221 [Drosophila setifemur]|nr:hypothetical protein KR009_008221 [Drosophila setifemur]
MSTSRMSNMRSASIHARQRQTKTGRMTRYSVFTMKRPLTFQVRRSLVEYVDMELADMDTSVFYQRIFILAKNMRLTPEEVEVEVVPEVPTTEPEAPPPDQVEEAAAEPVEQGVEFVTELLIEDDEENTKEVLTHTFRFDDDDEAEGEGEDKDKENAGGDDLPEEEASAGKPKDFFAIFTERLQELHKKCRASAITPDPMCGLYLHMGDYSLLMLESAEDMMGCFCKELSECCENFWLANRVFQIEDHISEMYTNELTFRRIPSVFLNEKFPTSTPTDEYLMGKQHMIIKEKLLIICRLISEGQQKDAEALSIRESFDDSDERNPTSHLSKSSMMSEYLPVDIYRKHLPEIQRIELVLASTRFYFELFEFNALYGHTPFAPDEEGLFWPIQNNYTPPNIFRRTPYDINLTFADYATVSAKEEEVGNEEIEEAAGEAEEAPPKAETPPQTE